MYIIPKNKIGGGLEMRLNDFSLHMDIRNVHILPSASPPPPSPHPLLLPFLPPPLLFTPSPSLFTPTSPSYIYFNQWSKSTYINSLRCPKEVLSQEDKIELVVFWQCCWSSDWIVSSVVVHKCYRNCVEYNNHDKADGQFCEQLTKIFDTN